MYKYVWSYGSDKELQTYWASGFWSREKETYVHFLANAFGGMWKASFMGFGHHSAIAKSAGILFLLTLTLAVFKKAFKDQRLLILIVSYAVIFLLTMILINGLGLWPVGHLRPNLFIDAQCIGVFILVVSCPTSEHVRNMLAILIIFMAIVRIGQVHVNDLVNLSSPREETDVVFADFQKDGKVGKLINETCKNNQKTVVFLNPGAASAYDYYSLIDSKKESFKNSLPRCIQFKQIPNAYSSPEKVEATIKELNLTLDSIWMAYSHLSHDETQALIDVASNGADVDSMMNYVGASYFQVIKKPAKGLE